MADQVEFTEYDKAMMNLAEQFQKVIKESLAKPYPFAPGYNKSGKVFGVRNMTKQTGDLYKSIEVTFDSSTDQIQISMLDYWKYVNDGRKPGSYVPIKPLMKWIRSKGFNKSKTSGKFQKFNIKGMAFAVSKNIQKFGIAPTNFYDDAFGQFEKMFQDKALQALGIDMVNFYNKVVEKELIKE
jgi:hypothetical protein